MSSRAFIAFAFFVLLISLQTMACWGIDDGDDTPDGDVTDGDITDGDVADGMEGDAAFTWEATPGTLNLYVTSVMENVPDGTTFDWDFGDETSEEGYSINHLYAAPGEYLVTLTVTRPGKSPESGSQTATVTGYGAVKWKYEFADTEWGVETGNGSVAVAADGTIYALVTPVGGARIIYSLAPDGSMNWRFTDFDDPERSGCADPIYSDISDTLYVVCNLFPGAAAYTTVVTAISGTGAKKWTAMLPDGQTAELLAIALRSFSETRTDRLYLGTDIGPESDRLAGIYTIDHTGAVTKSSYESAESIKGLALGNSGILHVLDVKGKVQVLSDGFASLWSYEPPGEAIPTGYLAIDATNRVYLPVSYPAGLVALDADLGDSNGMLWSYSAAGEPGPPTIDAAGHVCFVESGVGLTTLNASDGTVAWTSNLYGGTGQHAIAALDDGSLIANMDHAEIAFDPEGERYGWTSPAMMTGVVAVATDGTMYVFGRRDDNTVYSDALYAIYGPAALANTWTRYRGDNANTGRLPAAVSK